MKVEVAVLGSPSLIVRTVSVDVKQIELDHVFHFTNWTRHCICHIHFLLYLTQVHVYLISVEDMLGINCRLASASLRLLAFLTEIVGQTELPTDKIHRQITKHAALQSHCN